MEEHSSSSQTAQKEEEDEEMICLDISFFVNRDYEITTFTFGPHVLRLYCLQSASTDYDLTGQLVWPGAMLLNDYLFKNTCMLEGCSVLELGSGVGISGILCSKFCREVVMSDRNDEVLEILRKNMELQASCENGNSSRLAVEKLEWGDEDHINKIVGKYPNGFDLIFGADIYILFGAFAKLHSVFIGFLFSLTMLKLSAIKHTTTFQYCRETSSP